MNLVWYRNDLRVAAHSPLQAALSESSGEAVSGPRALAVYCRSEERRVGKECRSRWSPYH